MLDGRYGVLVICDPRSNAVAVPALVEALRESTSLRPVAAVLRSRRSCRWTAAEHSSAPPPAVEKLDLARLTDAAARALAGYTASLETCAGYLANRMIDAIVVEGESARALAAALIGYSARLPVVHVVSESSSPLSAPASRRAHVRLLSQTADLHLVPTEESRARLIQEGVDGARIRVVGKLRTADGPATRDSTAGNVRAAIEALVAAGSTRPGDGPGSDDTRAAGAPTCR